MRLLVFILLGLVPAAPAAAQEVFGGLFAHDVDTPLTKAGQEGGADIQVGWRGERIGALRVIGGPSPHALASLNTSGDTNFIGGGLSWKIGDTYYLRPGIGVALHDGPGRFNTPPDRIDFGSRVLFVLEAGVGARIDDRWSVEATFLHFSHGQIFSAQNPGSDNIGVRLNYRY